MSIRCIVVSVAIGMALTSAPAEAQRVPAIMAYQGTLANGQGFPADDPVALEFQFFDAASDGNTLPVDEPWTERHEEVPVHNGRFSVLLGSRTEGGLPDALFDNRAELWLDIQVNNEPLAPRLPLTSVAFAREAQSVVDGAIGTDALASESVTSAQIAPGAVGSSNLGPGAVTESKVANGAISIAKLRPPVPSSDDGNRVLTYVAAIDEMSWESPRILPSSIRWKENVRTLDDAVALVERLRGVRYNWTESGAADVGVIAEEMSTVLPELVVFEENGQARGVHYAKLVAVLIEAIKAQQQALNTSEQRADALEARIERLEAAACQAVDTAHRSPASGC
jgi:hypothetical protein